MKAHTLPNRIPESQEGSEAPALEPVQPDQATPRRNRFVSVLGRPPVPQQYAYVWSPPPPCRLRPHRGHLQRDEALRPRFAPTAVGAGADRADRVTQTHHGSNHRAIPLPSPPLQEPLRKSRTGLNPVPQSPSEHTRMAPIPSRTPQQGTPSRLRFARKKSST